MTDLEQAEKNLADYVATLSPEKQEAANKIRADLDAIPDMGDRLKYIVNGLTKQFERLSRHLVVERVRATSNQLD